MALLLMSFWWDFLLCILLVFVGIYAWFKHSYTYWQKRGVYGPKPSFPTGNIAEFLQRKLHLGQILQKLYNENKSHPFIGIYLFRRKILLLNDLELIKNIMVKNFAHFTDHGLTFAKAEPLSQHLFNFNGARWKGVRNTLTPAFTSAKMKYMFETMASCGEELEKYLEVDAAVETEVNFKDIIAKFTTDVIVSCAMGVDSNSFKDPDAEFRRVGSKVFNLSLSGSILQSLVVMEPGLLKFINKSFLDKEVTEFFTKVVKKTVDYREKNGVSRNDMLQLLIRLKNNESIEDNPQEIKDTTTESLPKPSLSMAELTAQVFGFFIGGFETSSTMSSFILFELAKDPSIQETLHQEIDAVLERHDGKITYESIGEMTYLTMIIKEALRKYPTIPNLIRVCTKDFQIPGTEVVIEKGTQIMIPILGIQRDPEVYPNPEKFDPQRFAPENASALNNFAFLTFGEGPRMCIGNRFAMMVIRIALVSVLRKYRVISVTDSNKPIPIDIRTFVFAPAGGVTLRIKQRKQ